MKFLKLFSFVALVLTTFLGYSQATLPLTRTTWTGAEPTGWIKNGTSTYTSSFACSTNNAGKLDGTGDYFQVNFDSEPDQLSFAAKISGSSTSSLLVEESVDGTSWSTVNNITSIPTACNTFNYTLQSTSRYVKWTYTKVSQNVVLDDVSITKAIPTGPTITLSSTAISNLNYIVGNGPSANQTFTAEGNNLTNNITITAPTNFEIATNAAGPYNSSLTLNQSSGSVSTTNIYVRLIAGLNLNSYNGTLTASSTGATPQDVSLTGEVSQSADSDIIKIDASEATTIASTITDSAPLTATQGEQVWQFKVRDGGASLNDADNLPTILTNFTLAQGVGNQVGTWSDAINTIALFDGNTYIASGTVTANQIQFTSLNISVADNTEKTLSLRLSLKCPLGADALDGEDFVFSLSNANTTFATSGSGKTAFSAQKSDNGFNVITVAGTQLNFTTQPTTTGLNTSMSDVVVSVTDACGNIDIDFNGNISITSTGTMTGDPITVTASNGSGTYTNILHTALGSNLMLTTSASGYTSTNSSLFDITETTTLGLGDLAILAVNTNIVDSRDQLVFVCFKDILPGTTFFMTDNGYERRYANEWGGTEGVISFTRIGTTLPKGTIITFESSTGNVIYPSQYDLYTCGSVDTNWTKTALSGGSIGGFNLNSDDDVWIMQGGTWTNDTAHHSTYDGTVLYGWTESGWNNAPGGSTGDTKHSTLFPGLECFSTVAPTGPGFVKFNNPNDPDFSTTTNARLDWIALINNTSNWDTYADNAAYNAGGYDYKASTSCPEMTIVTSTYIDGKWTGKVDEDWFNCSNWDTLKVPDETVHVQVNDNTYNRGAIVDVNSPYATYYSEIASAKSLSISGEKVEISNDANNLLEVYGDLNLSGGELNFTGTETTSGTLKISGNWTNTAGNTAFNEGNGTVFFNGNTAQIISNVAPRATEEFYNLILDNNFNTSVSNDLYLNGSLTINSGKNLVIDTNNYASVNKNVSINGTLTINNTGSLIQIDDSGVNTGIMDMNRTASIKNQDYVYWSSPAENFTVNNIWSTSRIYKWGPTAINANGTEGNWLAANGETMVAGKGYILQAPAGTSSIATNYTTTFTGKPQNGVITIPVSRGNDTPANNDDDNWNLVGNPYPSAIAADDFLNENSSVIKGWIKLWSHGNPPSAAYTDPFYEDFVYNYNENDYITYNYLGATTGPGTFNGYIAAGQGFFVNMVTGSAATQNITFKNAFREKTTDYNNTEFFRTTNQNEKHRFWLDLINNTSEENNRILIGYATNATQERDHFYDAINLNSNVQNFYSIINQEPFTIQGRSLPFMDTDVVPLGMEIVNSGSYTIAIHAIDGLFETENQTIYLKDNDLGIIHNLSNQPYTFVIENGIINNRFEIVFKESNLSVTENELVTNVILYENENGSITISTPKNLGITNIKIFDVLGKLVFSQKGNNQNKQTFSLNNFSQAAYLAKVTLSNQVVVTKKAVKQK